jgi:YrbI family 3-deoxy-D-manno-octulosonate 8-phosphate phosphatase
MRDVLALVPTRGGSKGLPRKNLRLLQGHPLVAWAIAAGRQARSVTRTICSTDDPEIAEVARKYGADVPYLRPPHLAGDTTVDLPVFQHALDWLQREEGWTPEAVVQLRATSPIRAEGLVDAGIELLDADPAATSVRSVCIAPQTPFKMWRIAEGVTGATPYMSPLLDVPGLAEPFNAPRQELPVAWWQTGTLDIVRAEVIRSGSMSGTRVLPLRIETALAVDIDVASDLERAERVMANLRCVRPGPVPEWSKVRILAVDVDGTLTPGTMYYDGKGEALKRFHTHDGKGLERVRAAGVHVAILTQENTPFIVARARKLGVEDLQIGVTDKLSALRQLCERVGVSLAEIAFVGDDVGDAAALQAVAAAGGLACAVADARAEARVAANFICPHRGGEGAVRDVCDRIVGASTP